MKRLCFCTSKIHVQLAFVVGHPQLFKFEIVQSVITILLIAKLVEIGKMSISAKTKHTVTCYSMEIPQICMMN